MTRQMKDDEILKLIKDGDELALEVLYKKNYRMMVRMIIKNNGTEDEAKDIFQEAIMVVWQKVIKDELVLTSKLSTYIYSICQNLWRKELERKKRLSSEEKDGVQNLDHDQKEQIKVIRKCIGQLGETCQKVLSYYYFDGLSMSDIAEKMGFANADTAKTKKYKCKKELDKKVKSQYKASDFFD